MSIMDRSDPETTLNAVMPQSGQLTPIPGSKVFSDADTRLFSIHGVVCRFPAGVHFGMKVENPVPLLDAEGNLIGSARLTADIDGTIQADALFQYGCPERLSIETGISHYLHPSMNQNFLYIGPEDFKRFGIPVTGEFTTAPDSTTKPLPVKRVPFIVVVIDKLMLTSDPRIDSVVDPVVATDEESA